LDEAAAKNWLKVVADVIEGEAGAIWDIYKYMYIHSYLRELRVGRRMLSKVKRELAQKDDNEGAAKD